MKFLIIIALILSAAALALTLNRELEGPSILPTLPKQAVSVEEDNHELKDELLKLRMRIASLEKAVDKKTREMEPIPQIQEEIAELATFQNDLAEYTLNIDPLNVIGTQEREIEDAYSILLDENKSAGERAKQAALLKRYGLFDEEAVASMTDMFFNAKDTYAKAAALSTLKDHVSPEIRQGVLDTFSSDIADGYKNARFRYQGIEALKPLLPDPEVEAMLTIIAQNDPQIKIANIAANSLGLPTRTVPSKAKDRDGGNTSDKPRDTPKRDG